jgi:hypothetical protein
LIRILVASYIPGLFTNPSAPRTLKGMPAGHSLEKVFIKDFEKIIL